MTWIVGKTMVGLAAPGVSATTETEQQAKYRLSNIVRIHHETYMQALKGSEFSWYGPMLKLEWLAEVLEAGKWPGGSDGLNWLWSVAWGDEQYARRDCWVFWAKCNPGPNDPNPAIPLIPRDGIKREMAA